MQLLLSRTIFFIAAISLSSSSFAAGFPFFINKPVKFTDLGSGSEDEVPEYETQVVSMRSQLLSGTMIGPFPDLRCSFKVSNDQGVHWQRDFSRRHPDFEVAANPTVAISPDGTMYAVCMSAYWDYRGGLLEIARSEDHGQTWTDWKAIPDIKGLPDKPWIAASSKEIAISYSNIELSGGTPPTATSYIELIRSNDGGQSWTKPQKISLGDYSSGCDVGICGDQGSFISYLENEDLAISWGGYFRGPIRFMRVNPGSDNNIAKVSDHGVDTPITQFKVNHRTNEIAVYWYTAHQFGPAYVARSSDGGINWYEEKLSDHGSVVTGEYDNDGDLNLIWLEKNQGFIDVKRLKMGSPIGVPTSLIGGPFQRPEEPEYFGGYHSLICTSNNQLIAFWIDLRQSRSRITRSDLGSSCLR